MPAQIVNAYLGSKLRSIHDVINDNHTALAGYGMFIFEVSAVLSCFMTLLNHFILMTPRLTRLPFIIAKVYEWLVVVPFCIFFTLDLILVWVIYFLSLNQVIVGVSLMIWVVQKAKSELAAALLDSIDVDEKLLIEVDV